ncbi:MAG: hypothetical protein HC927_04515 [Deltaproteobacteria bacterium]|nr:hypothetical protein [Deltaproteobacteria bacterium]
MFASLVVIGTMVALILLSVSFFGGEVAEGPLQVSMTLSTLLALAVAYFYGFRGSVISEAIANSLHGVMGTIFVILAIGTLIGTLYLAGTVPAIIYYGVALISAQFYYVTVFAIALGLGMMLGSSLTTVGAVGVAFVGLAAAIGVNPAITGGAAVAGAVIGDKTAKISDTVILITASVGGVSVADHTRTVLRTAIPTIVISALLFLILGLVGGNATASVDPAQVQDAISRSFNISLWAFLPILAIFVLSLLRFSAFMALMLSALLAVLLATVTQQELIVALAADPGLAYWEAALKVGIETLADGFQLESGVEQLDRIFAGGGATGMLTTLWLILVAASFGAVVDYTGMLARAIAPVVNWATGTVKLILTTMLSSLGLNLVTADPYVSIVLASRMFRGQYIKSRLKPVLLSTAIADSGTILSNIIPWNVHGALFAATLGIGTLAWAPFTFTAYLTPVVTFILAWVHYLRKDRIAASEDAGQIYGAEPTMLPEPARLA